MAISVPNGLSSIPALNGFAVTPSDSVDLAAASRGIYVGVSGNVKVTTLNGDAVTFVGLAAGIIHPIAASRVWSTGTAATSIVAVY
jgi:hypothetical protein